MILKLNVRRKRLTVVIDAFQLLQVFNLKSNTGISFWRQTDMLKKSWIIWQKSC